MNDFTKEIHKLKEYINLEFNEGCLEMKCDDCPLLNKNGINSELCTIMKKLISQ